MRTSPRASSSVRRWVSTLALMPVQVALQLGEAPWAVRELAKHQHRPALAEQFHRMGEAAGIVVAPFFLAFPPFSYFF